MGARRPKASSSAHPDAPSEHAGLQGQDRRRLTRGEAPSWLRPIDVVGSARPSNSHERRGREADLGALKWQFLRTFVGARQSFLNIHRLYDRRVLRAARAKGVHRDDLKLPPKHLFNLFHLRRLELLRDGRLEPLARMAHRIFGDDGDEGLLDAYCGHIFHEVSILSREHRSVGRFVRRHDPHRYRVLFEEVRGYYPQRLKRVKRFFRLATKRVNELLPQWAEERIVVRSVHLFGDELSRRAGGRDRSMLYTRMYPEGGVVRGHAEAAKSFADGGFGRQAYEAVADTLLAAKAARATRTLTKDERSALRAAQSLAKRLPAPEDGASSKFA